MNSHAGEHKTPEYLLMNPQATIPTLDDNGKYICDSHAITRYLATVYGTDDSLCPKDAHLRAVLDQRLHFEDSVLWARFGAVVTPIHMGKATEFEKDALDALLAAYDVLEIYLTKNHYLVGDNLTVADFSVATDFTTAKIFIPSLSDRVRYPNTFAWLDRMNKLTYFEEVNNQPLEKLYDMFKDKFNLKK